MNHDKLVLITRPTRLEELIERFNTRAQARFYLEHMGLDFQDYDAEHTTYTAAVRAVRRDLERTGVKVQQIDWTYLPTFVFAPGDVVVPVGRDGLVVNTAKYLDDQFVVAVNPDPSRNDGVLLPFLPGGVLQGVRAVLEGRPCFSSITMAEVALNDGQRLLAFNDFYIGQRTHLSSRYTLTWNEETERQSSSGVLVSTGAGSTGWLSSTRNMAQAVTRLLAPRHNHELPDLKLSWADPRLVFVVREPFRSRWSEIRLTAGLIDAGQELRLESLMPDGGVIFSDGVEADALAFNSGSVASVRASQRRTRLVTG